MNAFNLNELQAITRTGIGLVIGPGLTENPGHENALRRSLSTIAKVELDEAKSFLDVADAAFASNNVSSVVIRDLVEAHFSTPHSASPDIHRLISANFRAVVSLVFDAHFKQRYAENTESKPIGKLIATIASASDRQPAGSLPYFSLLGDLGDRREDRRLIVSKSEYISRKAIWPKILRTLPESLLGDPLFIIGFANSTDRLSDFLTSLLSLGVRYPRRLIFLEGDPILENPTFSRLLEEEFDSAVLAASIRDVGDAFSKETLSVKTLPLWSIESERFFSPDLVSRVDDRLSYVPRRTEINPNPESRTKHLDSLFRPTHLDWDPYALELPFEREITTDLVSKIDESPTKSIVRFGGDAGVGKTVTLRQAAYSLAQTNQVCFWFRRFFDNASSSVFDDLINVFNSHAKVKDTSFCFFLDDPIGVRVNESMFVDALQRAKFSWKLVVCQRSSEAAISRAASFDVVFPNEFSVNELERFKLYQASLGIITESGAVGTIGSGMAFAKDILCNLWYSLPQTKTAISEAISGEFDRLSGIDSIIEAFISGDGHNTMTLARMAYEMVAVCSSVGSIGLPVEVLVSALDISYEEWGDYCVDGSPVWGLIYDEESPSIESWVYRTRNHVVTEILIQHFRRSEGQQSHEFRTLLKLIRGCTAGSAPYKQFLLDVLVTNRRQIEQRFDLARASELFEAALEVFPRKLGVVEFHYLICKRNLGGDSLEIYDEMNSLIGRSSRDPDDYDSLDKLETSAAATVLKAYRDDKISGKDASEAIYRHTTTALGLAPHSLHAIHAQANALLKIGAEIRSESSLDSAENIIRASNLIERALMAFGTDGAVSEEEVETLRMFNSLRDDYLAALPASDNQRRALLDKYLATGSQVFLIMAVRMELGRALKIGKGGLFKDAGECLEQAFGLVYSRSDKPEPDLCACRVQFNFEWRLRLSSAPINWEEFRDDLNLVRAHRRFRDDPFWDFLYAVCLFHLSDFNVADQCFAKLRNRSLNRRFSSLRRCYFQGDKGEPKVFEGSVSFGPEGNAYLFSSELGTDVRGERGRFRESSEEIKFFKISFSMFGPTAVPAQ